VLFEALGQRSDFDVAEVAPRLEGILLDLVDGKLKERGARV
jgi:hypothetical protein